MKIPTRPEKCLFARKEIFSTVINIVTNEINPIYKYYCNINMKRCDIDCGGKCNKLKVLVK